MASSFKRKSSSSASKAPKPTYRRASAKPKASTSKAPSPSPRGGRAGVPGAGAKALGSKRPAVKPASPAIKASRPAVKASRPVVKPSASKRPAVKPASVAASGRSVKAAPLRLLLGAIAAPAGAMSGLVKNLKIPKPSRAALAIVSGSLIALLVTVVVVVNSALFAATDIQVRGSAHLEQQAAQALVEVPDGTTLLNVDEGAILEQLAASPWVKDVEVERLWPHTLVIAPVERQVKAIAYITADEVAWAIGEDGTWIAPVSLIVAVDAEGSEVEVGADGSVPEGATLLSGQDAALRMAQDAGCLLFTDVPSDISPKSGEEVSSKVVLAGLAYANGFSPEFIAQIKSLSVSSVEAISANLTSGVEVSLGAPENITEKERVVTKLLSQETGVTFINVREPGAYTFRSAPQ